MEKDKALEALFQAQKPQFTDGGQFMARLTRRLDAVEYLRQEQEATMRRYKMAMVAAFALGIVGGAAAIMFMFSLPADVPLFTIRVKAGALLWLADNSRWIAASAVSLLMTVGIICTIGNVQDIMAMRAAMGIGHKHQKNE